MRKALLLSLPVLAACVVGAAFLFRSPAELPPKGRVIQKLEDHFAGPWGWIEDHEGREWFVIGRGRQRIPYNRESVGIAAEPDGWMSKRLVSLAGSLPFPVVYRISNENEIDGIWRASDGVQLWPN